MHKKVSMMMCMAQSHGGYRTRISTSLLQCCHIGHAQLAEGCCQYASTCFNTLLRVCWIAWVVRIEPQRGLIALCRLSPQVWTAAHLGKARQDEVTELQCIRPALCCEGAVTSQKLLQHVFRLPMPRQEDLLSHMAMHGWQNRTGADTVEGKPVERSSSSVTISVCSYDQCAGQPVCKAESGSLTVWDLCGTCVGLVSRLWITARSAPVELN